MTLISAGIPIGFTACITGSFDTTPATRQLRIIYTCVDLMMGNASR
jgi:hypothetical protein